MDTLTSYRGRFKDGIITTEPPIPAGEELDVLVTVLQAEATKSDQKSAPNPPEYYFDIVSKITAHIHEDLSELIIQERDA